MSFLAKIGSLFKDKVSPDEKEMEYTSLRQQKYSYNRAVQKSMSPGAVESVAEEILFKVNDSDKALSSKELEACEELTDRLNDYHRAVLEHPQGSLGDVTDQFIAASKALRAFRSEHSRIAIIGFNSKHT